MTFQWQTLIFKMTFWLFLEVFLGVLGLDNIADYSEFTLINYLDKSHQNTFQSENLNHC